MPDVYPLKINELPGVRKVFSRSFGAPNLTARVKNTWDREYTRLVVPQKNPRSRLSKVNPVISSFVQRGSKTELSVEEAPKTGAYLLQCRFS